MSNNNANNEKDISYKEYIKRISNENIPVYEPSLGKNELDNLTKVIKSNWISEGEYTREFESKLSALCQRPYAVAFANATSALIAGMKSMKIGPGDEVIVPSFSHSADANSVSVAGAKVVFSDVDYNTLCLSTDTIKRSLKKKQKLYCMSAHMGM